MTRNEAHEMLDAVKAGFLKLNAHQISEALRATGDLQTWQRSRNPLIRTIRNPLHMSGTRFDEKPQPTENQ